MKRLFIVLLIAVTVFTGMLAGMPTSMSSSSIAYADEAVLVDEPRPTPKPAVAGVRRVYGETAVDTSIEIAKALKKELGIKKFKSVILVSGENFPDALSAAPFAERRLGPILQVPKKNADKVINYVKSNIDPNGKVYIIGGRFAVSEDIEKSVSRFAEVERIYGNDRYDTNIAVLEKMNPKKGMRLFVCSGKSFNDALAASATGLPILLVGDRISSRQAKFLSNYITSKSKVYIAGGKLAVSDQVVSTIKNHTEHVKRLKGPDSYSTAIAIAKRFAPDNKQALLATTKTYKDGLSGSVLAYVRNCPLLLTARTNKFEAAYNYITSNKVTSVTILGGPAAVDTDATGLNSEGGRKKGFLSVGGKTYFADARYEIQKDLVFPYKYKNYYVDKSGALVKSASFTKDGTAWIADKNGVLSQASKVIYLTFDDGPGPYTSRLIDILDKYGAKATFFVNGYRPSYNYLIGKAYRSGHAIGNHTYSHDYSIYRSSYAFWSDVDRMNDVIKAQTGTSSKLLRFPGGSSNTVSRQYATGIMRTLTSQCAQRGWTYFDWNVDSYDAGGTYTASGIYSNITSGVAGRNSSVVLCHDIKGYTVDAIEDVLIWGRRNGYVFLPLTSSAPTAHHGVNN